MTRTMSKIIRRLLKWEKPPVIKNYDEVRTCERVIVVRTTKADHHHSV
jgi:hypothetical protein